MSTVSGRGRGLVTFEPTRESLMAAKKALDKVSLKLGQREQISILKRASFPIRKRAKQKAKRVIGMNRGMKFTRKRSKTEYDIPQGTLEKSIGTIELRQARVPVVDVGYRAGRGKYDGWFAHFVDEGTANRETKYPKAYRGRIEPHNIMEAGLTKMPQARARIEKEINRMIKRLNK